MDRIFSSQKINSPFSQARTQEQKHFIIIVLCLLLALGLFFFLNLCIGSIRIPWQKAFQILIKGECGDANDLVSIIWKIRLPRILATIFLGAALALSGYLLQIFFRNPIAGPFILGISSGAKMGVAFFILSSTPLQLRMGQSSSIFFALLGSLMNLTIILLFAQRLERRSTLIVSGVMLAYLSSAITDILISFADDHSIATLQFWSKGSFFGMSWESVRSMAIPIPLCIFAVFLLSKPIAAYQLGDSYAQNSGVRLRLFRTLLVLLSSLLAATVTTFAGPISFVGLAVPHLVKGLLRTSKPHFLIPSIALMGSVFCLVCDLIARSLIAPLEIRISAVTAIFGAPVVLWVMFRRKKSK